MHFGCMSHAAELRQTVNSVKLYSFCKIVAYRVDSKVLVTSPISTLFYSVKSSRVLRDCGYGPR